MSKKPQRVSWVGATDVAAAQGTCPHGRSYGGGCRCLVCRATAAHYMRNFRRRQAERSWGKVSPTELVEATPTSAAIQEAHAVHSITQAEISRVTGLSRASVEDLFNGKRARVTRATQDAVLEAYGPDKLHPRAFAERQLVDFRQYAWKLHALIAQGWTAKLLREMLTADGRSAGFVDHLTDRKQIRHSNAKHIDWLVQQIGDKHGPCASNKGRMAVRGIFPLIHYTDEGKLIRGSLTEAQLKAWRRVQ